MPIKITQKLGNKKKQFNVLTKEELSELFGGNIARAGEALGRQAELDKNLGILNDEKLPELDNKLNQLEIDLSDLDDELGILDNNLTQLDTNLSDLDDKLYNLDTGDIPQLNDELGILDSNLSNLDDELNTLDGYFNNPSTIPSNYNFFSGIVAEQAWIDALVANQAWLDELFVNNAYADRITANDIQANEITSNKINVSELIGSNVFANELVANQAWLDELFVNNAYADRITANDIQANEITANEINVSQLVASNVFANEFVANEGYVDQLIANDVFADKITANEVDIADLFAQTITVGGTISGNYSSNSGWRIQGNGNAEFNNVTVRGSGSSVADWQVQSSNRSLFKTIPNTDFSYVHITNEPWGGDVTAGAGVRFANSDLNSDTEVKYAHVGQLHELDSNDFTGNADASDAEWGIEVMLGQGSSSYKHIFRAGNGGVLLTNPNDDFRIDDRGIALKTSSGFLADRAIKFLTDIDNLGSAVANVYGLSSSLVLSATSGNDLDLRAVSSSNAVKVTGSGGFEVPQRTNSARDSMSPNNGSIIYNTSTDRFQGRQDGSWVNLS